MIQLWNEIPSFAGEAPSFLVELNLDFSPFSPKIHSLFRSHFQVEDDRTVSPLWLSPCCGAVPTSTWSQRPSARRVLLEGSDGLKATGARFWTSGSCLDMEKHRTQEWEVQVKSLWNPRNWLKGQFVIILWNIWRKIHGFLKTQVWSWNCAAAKFSKSNVTKRQGMSIWVRVNSWAVFKPKISRMVNRCSKNKHISFFFLKYPSLASGKYDQWLLTR